MTLSVAKYSSVSAKARAMYGNLLSRDDYMELLGSKSVPEVALYLKKNTSYNTLLAEINENLVHRGELEKLFKSSLYGDFVKLLKFLKGNPARFLQKSFLRYEIEDLKTLIRVIYNGRNIEEMVDSLVFLKKYSSLDFPRLTASRSITDLISSLKGSAYYKVLVPFLENKERQKLFDMEMSLDLHFFLMIIKLTDELLTGDDRTSVVQSFGIEIDILNILMIYRCKRLFNLNREVIIKYIVPYWQRLSREQLVSLSESRNLEEFNERLSKTKYAEVFRPGEEHLWETESMNYLYRIYKSHLRENYFNIGATLAYIHLKEMDIRNIITLIEGIRYNIPREEIKSYLVGISR